MWERGYIPLLDTRRLPWEPFAVVGLSAGLEHKLLSRDPTDEASTRLVRFPVGWRTATTFRPAAPVHLFIVSGRLLVGDAPFEEGCYTYVPRAAELPPLRAVEETVVLWFWDGPLGQADPLAMPDPADPPVPRLDSRELPWVMGPTEGPAAGLGWKMLRHVPATGESVFVAAMLPYWREPRVEYHACVEESFKLLGEMDLGPPTGVMEAYGYFFRPPYVRHGPMLTRCGTMSLIRTSAWITNFYEDPPPPPDLRISPGTR
ncbi:MAG: hypothetical protein KatS3mg061_0255 [Dehalococcoidia bacterium]|nr:MAG: hypothetical protein KatS3mg061_0255 [Dehalococcoidia bacterium]